MPIAMTFLMKALGDLPPEHLREGVQASLLEKVGKAAVVPDSALRERPCPFTLSALQPAESARDRHEAGASTAGEATGLGRGDRFRIRMTWLEDAHLSALKSWARSLHAAPVHLELGFGAILVEGALANEGPGERWSRAIPYREMVSQASSSLRTLTLKFASPTLLNRSGVPYPLPDPLCIFQGYLHLWNSFSGTALGPGMRSAMQESLLINDFRIRRQSFDAGRGPVTGFAGSATFRLEGRYPETVLKGMNVLADFAFFCGTGTSTDKGMGLTRRIPENADED